MVPIEWFNNVEMVTAEKIGAETTTDVRNIYKYYVAYKLFVEVEEGVKEGAPIAGVGEVRAVRTAA